MALHNPERNSCGSSHWVAPELVLVVSVQSLVHKCPYYTWNQHVPCSQTVPEQFPGELWAQDSHVSTNPHICQGQLCLKHQPGAWKVQAQWLCAI